MSQLNLGVGIMPLHDHECVNCGHQHEEIIEWDNYSCLCPKCESTSVRIYKRFNGIQQDAPDWLKSVTEVVDKEGGPHCQQFLKHQNMSNYKAWMKGEGLRPFEQGEPMERKKADTSKLRKEVKQSFRDKNTITVRG